MPSKQRTSGRLISVDWKTVGRRVRELRGFDTTQADFGAALGISQNYVSMMESGQVEIGAEILLRLARKFRKSVEWLLVGEDR